MEEREGTRDRKRENEKKEKKHRKEKKEDGPKREVLPLLFDTHCHLHDDTYNRHLIADLEVSAVCLIGVKPTDWVTVQELHRSSDKIHAAFGNLSPPHPKARAYTLIFSWLV